MARSLILRTLTGLEDSINAGGKKGEVTAYFAKSGELFKNTLMLHTGGGRTL